VFYWLTTDAPVPPSALTLNTINTVSIVVRLQFPGRKGLAGVPVKIVVPVKGTLNGTTNERGLYASPLMTFPLPGMKEVTAEATLPDGTLRTAKLLLNVVNASDQ
jgi:hypothetical protein